MTDDQVPSVVALARKAGIEATNTRVGPNDALLAELAPGPRVFQPPITSPVAPHRAARSRTETATRAVRGHNTSARRSGAAEFSANRKTGVRRKSR